MLFLYWIKERHCAGSDMSRYLRSGTNASPVFYQSFQQVMGPMTPWKRGDQDAKYHPRDDEEADSRWGVKRRCDWTSIVVEVTTGGEGGGATFTEDLVSSGPALRVIRKKAWYQEEHSSGNSSVANELVDWMGSVGRSMDPGGVRWPVRAREESDLSLWREEMLTQVHPWGIPHSW